MTDGQLLAAISSMMDEKLEPIKADIAVLKQDVAELKQEVSVLKQDMIIVKNEIVVLKQITDRLQQQYLNMQIALEHEVVPQLHEIQTCYTSTYRRYASGVDQIDALQRDVDVLKSVVEDHSKKLRTMCS